MRMIGIAAALIVIAVGLVWAFQGAGMLGGSFMTGESRWLGIGVVTAAVGLFGLVQAIRPRR